MCCCTPPGTSHEYGQVIPIFMVLARGDDPPQTPPAPGGTHPPRPPLGEAPPPHSRLRRVVVVPLRSDRRLRYQDWVVSRRRLVRELSDGRLGYLHIPDMMGEGW